MAGLTPYREEAPAMPSTPTDVPIPRRWLGWCCKWLWDYQIVRRLLGGRWEYERVGHSVVGFWNVWRRVEQWTPARQLVQPTVHEALMLTAEGHSIEMKIHLRLALQMSSALGTDPEKDAEIATLTREIDKWLATDHRIYKRNYIDAREEW